MVGVLNLLNQLDELVAATLGHVRQLDDQLFDNRPAPFWFRALARLARDLADVSQSVQIELLLHFEQP